MFAYTWILFRGDRYLPGILTSAYSVKRTGTKHDLVCLVTKDVNIAARKKLKVIFDKVVIIPYIKAPAPLITEQQKKLYNAWIEISYTKWNVLKLVQYKKIFFLDGDTIVTRNIDSVFNTVGIAGTFSSPWTNKYNKKSKVIDYYGNKRIIGPELIKKALSQGGQSVVATSILLEPNMEHFKNFKLMLKNKKEIESFTEYNFSGGDEQSIAWFYSLSDYGPKVSWTNLPDCYQFFPWHRNDCFEKKKQGYVMHMFGELKAWEADYHKQLYPDLETWVAVFLEMMDTYGSKINIKEINIKYPDTLKDIKLNYNNKFFKLFKVKPYLK